MQYYHFISIIYYFYLVRRLLFTFLHAVFNASYTVSVFYVEHAFENLMRLTMKFKLH